MAKTGPHRYGDGSKGEKTEMMGEVNNQQQTVLSTSKYTDLEIGDILTCKYGSVMSTHLLYFSS